MNEDMDFGVPSTINQQEFSHQLNRVSFIDNDVTVGDWIITMLLMCIPLANIILLFVWAFDSSTKPSKANWAKASLVFVGISVVIGILFAVTLGSMIGTLMSHGGLPSTY